MYADFNFRRWLIGKGGRIYPPTGRPWRTGSGVGCLAGPLFCRTSCVDIGLFEVCYPGDGGGGGGETGPPGFPGGLIDGGGEPGDDPPPYEEPERVTEPEVSKTVDKKSTSVTRPASRSASATSSLTGSAAQYFIVATPGADVADINAFLGQIAPKPEGSYSPVFAADAVDGGFWTANLSSNSATLVLNRNDISIIATYTNTPASYPTWNPSTFSDTISVDLETLYASTISPSETAAAKVRRKFPDEGFNSDSELSSQDQIRNESAETQFKHRLQGREPARVYERDAGIRYVRQRFSPKDLSVLSWAPGRPSVDNVDFIFSERKGQNTWVYVLDTGINSGHAVGNPPLQWQIVTDIPSSGIGVSKQLAWSDASIQHRPSDSEGSNSRLVSANI